MVSDSIMNSSIPTALKDFGKKKRANRSAKLKQCKLDARRQQWLSQVNNNGPNSEGNGNGGMNREISGPAINTKKEKRKGEEKESENCCKAVEMRNVNVELIENHGSDSEESLMMNVYGGSSSSSSSSSNSGSSLSFESGGCCSGSITEEEEGRGPEDDGCLDDWETVADALVGVQTSDKQGFLDEKVRVEKGKSDGVGISGRVGVNSKAWRPDDASRPQSLPNLSTHGSFLGDSEMVSSHGLNLVPTSCPICCEDLDLTDSSFLPCCCGFRLCLFCHKRILEEDARCPGCRKPYTSETDERGTTIRLARSRSMFSRV